MCKDLKLIIEVDGLTHTFPEVMKDDLERQACLESAGFTILRFTDDEVLKDINGVKQTIEDWIVVNNKGLS